MNRERGVAALELVFSLPIFFAAFFAILYYGYAFIIYQEAIKAASAGAQALVAESPLSDGYDPLNSEAAFLAASEFSRSAVAKSDAASCLKPAPHAFAIGGERYRYEVQVTFTSCRVLRSLSVNLPFIGLVPPPLEDARASAVVGL